jgi:hypothetical protein
MPSGENERSCKSTVGLPTETAERSRSALFVCCVIGILSVLATIKGVVTGREVALTWHR